MIYQELPKIYEDLGQELGAKLMIAGWAIEAHYGKKKDPLEKICEEMGEEVVEMEEVDQKHTQKQISGFQSATPYVAKAQTAACRQRCAGAAHMHIAMQYVLERAAVPNNHDIIKHFTEHTHPSNVKVQHSGAVTMKTKQSQKGDQRLQMVSNTSQVLMYIVKDATKKRGLIALKTLGCVDLTSAATIAVYMEEYAALTEQALRDNFPIRVVQCYHQTHPPPKTPPRAFLV